MVNHRGLSPTFLADLKSGLLSPLHQLVLKDTSLALEIRSEAINIYYRGGSLLALAKHGRTYVATYDPNYFCPGAGLPPEKSTIATPLELCETMAKFRDRKYAIDTFVNDWAEAEVKQLISRDNNRGTIARSTDYFICDVEYRCNGGQFDMVAVQWPSTPSARKNQSGLGLTIIEIKYGDGCLDGPSGIHDHVRKIDKHFANPQTVTDLKKEMVRLFNQKWELGLIQCTKDIKSLSAAKPVLMLAMANHDPDSAVLRRALRTLPPPTNIDVVLARSCCLGYGLYDHGVVSLADAQSGSIGCI